MTGVIRRKSDEPLTDIYSTVSGNKYSFIGEGIYERKVTKKSRLSAGVKYQQSLADNTYGGNESSETKMHETHATAYVEYSGKMDRFNYSFDCKAVIPDSNRKRKDITGIRYCPV